MKGLSLPILMSDAKLTASRSFARIGSQSQFLNFDWFLTVNSCSSLLNFLAKDWLTIQGLLHSVSKLDCYLLFLLSKLILEGPLSGF